MTDLYAHADGSRECRPAGDGASAAMPQLFPADLGAPRPEGDTGGAIQLCRDQQATLDRTLADPRALLDIHAARIEQVTKWGHSDKSDADKKTAHHALKGAQWANDAADILRSNDADRNATARRRLIKAAALIWAEIDRIDQQTPTAANPPEWPDAAQMESNLA